MSLTTTHILLVQSLSLAAWVHLVHAHSVGSLELVSKKYIIVLHAISLCLAGVGDPRDGLQQFTFLAVDQFPFNDLMLQVGFLSYLTSPPSQGVIPLDLPSNKVILLTGYSYTPAESK